MTRPALKPLVLAAAAASLFAAVAPALASGTYTVSACSPGTTTGPWTVINTSPGGLNAGQLCGGPATGSPPISDEPGTILYQDQGAMYAHDNLNSSTIMNTGDRAGWLFTAPASTTITAISYYRGFMAFGDPNLRSGLFQASGASLEQCTVSTAFGSPLYCSMSTAPATFTGLSTGSLFFGVQCDVIAAGTGSCTAGGSPQHAAQADLYSAQVTLTEAATPVITGAAGSLWGGGVAAGVTPVTFNASDPSGIQTAIVRSDGGATLATKTQTCDFTSVVPCPQLPAGSLSVNTTLVPDGPHTFTVVVSDAAGNTQSVTSPSVVVDNNGPAAPVGLAAVAASSSSNVIKLTWVNPPGPPEPIASGLVELCQTTCGAPQSIAASGAGQVTAPAAGAYTVRLWLIDTQGRGSATNAATASATVPAGTTSPPGGGTKPPGTNPGSSPATKLHTKLTAAIKGRTLHVSGTLATLAKGTVKVSWRSHELIHTIATGSRTVTIHDHKISVTFTLSHAARRGTVGVAVRSGRRTLIAALAKK